MTPEELNITLAIAFGQLILFLIFLVSTAEIDAWHFERKHWVTDKTTRLIQRASFLAAIAAISMNAWHFIAFGLLFASLFDLTLNYLRKDIDDLWHLGQNAVWDRFWSNHLKLYKFFRYLMLLLGVFVYMWFL